MSSAMLLGSVTSRCGEQSFSGAAVTSVSTSVLLLLLLSSRSFLKFGHFPDKTTTAISRYPWFACRTGPRRAGRRYGYTYSVDTENAVLLTLVVVVCLCMLYFRMKLFTRIKPVHTNKFGCLSRRSLADYPMKCIRRPDSEVPAA